MTPNNRGACNAKWFRYAPAIILLTPFLLLVPGLDRGQGKSAKERNKKKVGREVLPPVAAEARFTDESVLKLILRDKVIRLNTAYGQLRVPAGNIRHIDFATRIPPSVARRVELTVANLGSPQFKVREAAGTQLLELREAAYPALLKALRHKDPEVVRRAEALLKQLREAIPPDQLAFRKDDVIWTADSRITGRLEGDAIKAYTYQFGEVQLKFGHLRSLQYTAVAPDPGNLQSLRGLVGKTFRFKVTGTTDGSIFGTWVYTSDSPLATVAVHAGALKAGQTGVVRVTILAPPAAFGASAQNGVTSAAYGSFGGAYQVSAELLSSSSAATAEPAPALQTNLPPPPPVPQPVAAGR
jgi:hypothetical protein